MYNFIKKIELFLPSCHIWGMRDEQEHITDEEMARRLVFALLAPAAVFSRVFGIALTDVRGLLDIAYFQESRRQGLTLQAIADSMQVSMSKAALLSRALKSNFLEDTQADVSRRILFMLWAGPLSAARIKQVLTDVEPRGVSKVLKELVKEKKVAKSGQEYTLLVQADRRVWDSWLARIDGMNNILGNLADAVYGRFFAEEALAFARTLAFRVRPEDVHELEVLYKTIFEVVTRLDSAAEGAANAVEINLSVLWSEKELIANNMMDTNTNRE